MLILAEFTLRRGSLLVQLIHELPFSKMSKTLALVRSRNVRE